MVLVCVNELMIDLGTVTEMNKESKRERCFRKKYIGVERRWSTEVRVMMRILPRRAVM